MGIYVPGKGVRRTKVVRDDGHVFEDISGIDLARRVYTAEDGFVSVTEIYGHDVDLDGPRVKVSSGELMASVLGPLSPSELGILSDELFRGLRRCREVYPHSYDAEGNDTQDRIVLDMSRIDHDVMNEYWGRQFGCRWEGCEVCRHSSCSYCPACNPRGISPKGEANEYVGDEPTDDTEHDCPC